MEFCDTILCGISKFKEKVCRIRISMLEIRQIYRKPPFLISTWRTTLKNVFSNNLLPLHSTIIFVLIKVFQLEFPNNFMYTFFHFAILDSKWRPFMCCQSGLQII